MTAERMAAKSFDMTRCTNGPPKPLMKDVSAVDVHLSQRIHRQKVFQHHDRPREGRVAVKAFPRRRREAPEAPQPMHRQKPALTCAQPHLAVRPTQEKKRL
ncbi:hypothetical protein KNE206_30660 [Kitasatospora sp. NE20-6]